MGIQKIQNNSIIQGDKKSNIFFDTPYLKGLAISSGIGFASPLLLLMDGEKIKNIKNEFKLKNCAKSAGIGAILYTGYKGIDTFVKNDNKKTEEKLKTGLWAGFGGITFPLITKTLIKDIKNADNQSILKTSKGKAILLLTSLLGIILPFIKIKKFD